MSQTQTKEVAVKEETAIAMPEEMLGAFMEDAGAGTENIGADDMKIPFIRVLQPVSPQLKKKDSAHIPGAEAGDIFDLLIESIFCLQFFQGGNVRSAQSTFFLIVIPLFVMRKR